MPYCHDTPWDLLIYTSGDLIVLHALTAEGLEALRFLGSTGGAALALGAEAAQEAFRSLDSLAVSSLTLG